MAGDGGQRVKPQSFTAPFVTLAHSHTWEMGFDTTCPFGSKDLG